MCHKVRQAVFLPFESPADASVHAKVKVNFTLEQAMKTQRGSRGIALPFL
jgi:hypothetical protein